MTRDEAVAMIKLQLGFRTNQDANIVSCLKLAQTQLELQPVKPWFLLSEDSYIRLTAAEERLQIPSDFLCEFDEGTLYYVPDASADPSDHVELEKHEYDHLKYRFKSIESGPPQAYALVGKYFRLFPLPDYVYMVRMSYYKKGTILDANVENEWLEHAPLALMGAAGQMISEGPLRDTQATKIFQMWEAKGMASLSGRDTDRGMANRRLQMGGAV